MTKGSGWFDFTAASIAGKLVLSISGTREFDDAMFWHCLLREQ